MKQGLFFRVVLLPAIVTALALICGMLIFLGLKYAVTGGITGVRFHSAKQVLIYAALVPIIAAAGIVALRMPVYLRTRKQVQEKGGE